MTEPKREEARQRLRARAEAAGPPSTSILTWIDRPISKLDRAKEELSRLWSMSLKQLKALRGYRYETPLLLLSDELLQALLLRIDGHESVEKIRLDNYLVDLRTKFSEKHVQLVEAVVANTSALGLPIIMPTSDEGVQCSWTQGNHHLSTDIYEDGGADWFYRDRSTGFYTGGDYNLDP